MSKISRKIREIQDEMPRDGMVPVAALLSSTATSSGITVNFEKLSEISDYGIWKFLMRMYLVHEDLWDCIEESTPGVPKVNDNRK